MLAETVPAPCLSLLLLQSPLLDVAYSTLSMLHMLPVVVVPALHHKQCAQPAANVLVALET